MSILTREETEDLKNELKIILTDMEHALMGGETKYLTWTPDSEFYVSSIDIGFTSTYLESPWKHIGYYRTNFSFSFIEKSEESYLSIREWIRSFTNISSLISGAGFVERRIFFENQYKIIDNI